VTSKRVIEARLRAQLAEAVELREELNRQWAAASYTSSGTTTPELADVQLAQVAAVIAELEELLANVGATQARPSAAPPRAPSAVDLAAPPANDAPPPALPEYLSTKQAAALLGVSVKHLEGLRARGSGPPFVRIGHAVRYPAAELRAKK
jgi:hypothetical protein